MVHETYQSSRYNAKVIQIRDFSIPYRAASPAELGDVQDCDLRDYDGPAKKVV